MKIWSSLLILLFPAVCLSQPHPPLDKFIEQQVIIRDTTFESQEKATSYLRSLDPGRLRVVRNAIFADHGYVFDDSTLQRYFDEQYWYQKDDKEVSLSAVEKQNVNFVQSLEKRAKSRLQEFYDHFPNCNFPVQVTTEQEPNYTTRLDSFSVKVFLGGSPRYGEYFAGCTLNRAEEYRALLYVYETAAGGGGDSYRLASFKPTGWRVSNKELLNFRGDLGFSEFGQMRIPSALWIEVKQVRIEKGIIRGDRQKVYRETKWKWFQIETDGDVVQVEPK